VNKIVAHFQTDRVMKGVTADFLPTKDVFHLMPVDSAPGAKPAQVKVSDLKALFFVKDFDGNRNRQRSQEFTRPPVGRKIRVARVLRHASRRERQQRALLHRRVCRERGRASLVGGLFARSAAGVRLEADPAWPNEQGLSQRGLVLGLVDGVH